MAATWQIANLWMRQMSYEFHEDLPGLGDLAGLIGDDD
jgi:hypothetical protein